MEDKILVEQFLKNKSEEAFSHLYRAKTPHLFMMALRLTSRDESLAEELIQEMWIVAIKKLANFQWRSSLKTWLTGILINLSRQKRKQEEKEIATDISRIEESSYEPFLFSSFDLENAIEQLPYGYRQVVILHDIEGYKHKEIAEMLNIHEGTSKSQLYQARKALRMYLYDETKKVKS